MQVEQASLESLREVWNELLSKSELNSVFLTYEWVSAINKVYKPNLLVLKVSDNDKVIGIAPLKIKKGKIEFIGAPDSDYCDFIIARDKQQVLEEVFKYLRKIPYTVISLTDISEHSSTLSFLDGLDALKIKLVSDVCPRVELKQSFNDYLENFPGKRRREMMRKIRKAEQFGDITVEHLTTENEINIHLDNFFELHRKRWNKTKTLSKFNEEKNKAFFMQVVEELSQNEWVELNVLKIDNKPVAYDFGFNYNKEHISYNIAYDEDYSYCAPGLNMFMRLIDDSFKSGFKIFDFVRGDEPYKLKFANVINRNYKVNLYKKNIFSKSFWLYVKDRNYEGLKAILRKFKFLITPLRKIRENYRYIKIKMSHNKLLKKGLIYLRKYGAMFVLKKALRNLLSPIFLYREIIMYSKNLDEDIINAKPKIDVKIKKVEESDVSSHKYLEENAERLKREDCFIALDKDKIVYYIWVKYDDFYAEEVEATFRIKEQEAVLYDAATKFEYRGNRLHPAVVGHVLRYLKDKGIKKAYAGTLLDNYPSRKGFELNRFEKVSKAKYFRFFKKFSYKPRFKR